MIAGAVEKPDVVNVAGRDAVSKPGTHVFVMDCRRRAAPIGVIAIFLFLAAHAVAADESLFLCEANETLVFGCEVEGKVVSLCASRVFSETSGYFQYRFGKPGEIEFQYPATKIPPKGKFFLSSASYAGGGENMIRFNDSGGEYRVFDSMVRTHFVPGEPNYPAFKAGVVMRHDGETDVVLLCSDESASIRAVAFERLEREQFDDSVIP